MTTAVSVVNSKQQKEKRSANLVRTTRYRRRTCIIFSISVHQTLGKTGKILDLTILLVTSVMNIRSIAYFFITAIAIVITLIYGKSLLIPFVFALLLWFIIRAVRHLLDKVGFIKTKFPSWAKHILTSILILGALAFSSTVITSSINSLAKSYKKYETNVDLLVTKANQTLNINIKDFLNLFSIKIIYHKQLR